MTHYDDPVPRLPPTGLLLDYVHVSPEYYIDTLTGVVPGVGNVSVFVGSVNLGGNTGNDKDETDFAAHGWYFGPVGACSPGGFEFRKRMDTLDYIVG